MQLTPLNQAKAWRPRSSSVLLHLPSPTACAPRCGPTAEGGQRGEKYAHSKAIVAGMRLGQIALGYCNAPFPPLSLSFPLLSQFQSQSRPVNWPKLCLCQHTMQNNTEPFSGRGTMLDSIQSQLFYTRYLFFILLALKRMYGYV